MCVCDKSMMKFASVGDVFPSKDDEREMEARAQRAAEEQAVNAQREAAAKRARISQYVGPIAQLLEQYCANYPDCLPSPRLPSVREYLARLSYHSGCTDDVLLSMLVLLSNVIETTARTGEMECNYETVHHLILSCFVLAEKLCDDRVLHITNKAWAKVGGVLVADLNEWERFVLQVLDWELFINKQQYNLWVQFFADAEGITPRY